MSTATIFTLLVDELMSAARDAERRHGTKPGPQASGGRYRLMW